MHRRARPRTVKAWTEGAFTLVELAVVLLILAMLIAIAVPTFLGFRRRAQDGAAQSTIRNLFASAKVLYADGGDYRDASASALAEVEPSVRVVQAPSASTGPNMVAVYAQDPNFWYATALSDSGTCWALWDAATGSTGTSFAGYVPSDLDDCNPIWASTDPSVSWRSAWP